MYAQNFEIILDLLKFKNIRHEHFISTIGHIANYRKIAGKYTKRHKRQFSDRKENVEMAGDRRRPSAMTSLLFFCHSVTRIALYTSAGSGFCRKLWTNFLIKFLEQLEGPHSRSHCPL